MSLAVRKVRPADSREFAEKAQSLVRWTLDHAVDGTWPLPSACDLAAEYRSRRYANDTERVRALIRWAVAKNAAAGFVAGLGGVLALPVAIPGALTASLAIQAPMVAAIAKIHGHNPKDGHVQTMILLCMTGAGMANVARKAGVGLGKKLAIGALKKKVPGAVLAKINKLVGVTLLTKFGQKGVVNLVKLVPLVGGAVGATFDGATCYLVGRAADKAFRPAPAN